MNNISFRTNPGNAKIVDFIDLVCSLNDKQIKEYYIRVFGENEGDDYLEENDIHSMRECLTDPYSIWEIDEEEVLDEEIEYLISIKLQEETNK
jgi:hypothetical protein